MAIIPYSRELTTDELRTISVDLMDAVDEGESFIGSPTVTTDDADIEITNTQVSEESKKINGRIVPAGQAILFKAESDVVGKYTVKIVCMTDAGQRIEVAVIVRIVATSVS